jgi:anhydro-N-acetylmuramic acid kinase
MKDRIIKNFPINALGCMCGTSMDGLDLALIRTDGEKIYNFGISSFTPFSNVEREVLKRAVGKWQGARYVSEAATLIEEVHVKEINKYDADVVGFHGQTLAHDPINKRTHQVGSGEVISKLVQTPTVWDFRTMDVKQGGQGAPLTPFFHFACARFIQVKEVTAFLNLGGVGNITIVNPNFNKPEDNGALLAFDTGPANAPIDDIVYERLKKNYDSDGELALKGKVDQEVLWKFLSDDYFNLRPPKSLDRNSFWKFRKALSGLSTYDAIATATFACVESVKASLVSLPVKPKKVLVTGGGRRNKTIMTALSEKLDVEVSTVDEYGLDGDMLEAQAFGFLAVRVLRGLSTSSTNTTGVSLPLSGGKVSYPN